jgi:hypothetical protein
MTHRWVEVTIRLIGEDYKQTVDVYSQRINYDYFQQTRPGMVAEIVAVVNDLKIPQIMHIPLGPDEINEALYKEYALHKGQG